MTQAQAHELRHLEEDDFYRYLTTAPERQAATETDLHLISCSECRQELASLIQLLHPQDGTDPEPDLSSAEIRNALDLVLKEGSGKPRQRPWYRWGAIAATVIISVGLTSIGVLYLYLGAKSESLYLQAEGSLNRIYEPESPSNLRLDLPFQPSDQRRSGATHTETVATAEKYLNAALGVKQDMRAALLGMGYIQLRKGRFKEAEDEFQKILAGRSQDKQALLARGVARYEQALSSTDAGVRDACLTAALSDFAGVLSLAESAEARFNSALTLYQMGRHREALQAIDGYLARDPNSLWAYRLRDLRVRIQMNRSENLKGAVRRAAQGRDGATLENLARVVPYKIPPILRDLINEIIAVEHRPASPSTPNSSSLKWAADRLEAAYRKNTSETDYSHLIAFYNGLSESQRKIKQSLDSELTTAIAHFAKGDIRLALEQTDELSRGFESIGDYWQLVRVYQLRGTSNFYGKADLGLAAAEFSKMLKYANLACDPDLVAKSLGALGVSFAEQRRYEEALKLLSDLKSLAEAHGMESWIGYASSILGSVHLGLNRVDSCLREYTSAMTLAYRTMDPQVVVLSNEHLGSVMERLGRYPEARKYYQQAAKWQETFLAQGVLQPIPELEARRLNLLNSQGYLSLEMNDPAAAQTAFLNALSRPLDSMKRVEAVSRLGLGQAYLRAGDLERAQKEVLRIRRLGSVAGDPELAWQVSSLEGSLSRRLGQDASAMKHFQQAAEIVEGMRLRVPSFDLRKSFLIGRYDPFRQIVELLIKRDPKSALAVAERAKSMTLREYLRSTLNLKEDSHLDWSVSSYQDLSRMLPSDTRILEYFLSSEQLFAFLSGPEGTQSFVIQIPLDRLQSSVKGFLESIQANRSHEFELRSKSLYRELLEPILAGSDGNFDDLVIIPDGILHLLPFGSLADPSGKYVLERFAISYAPSQAVLGRCLERERSRIGRASSLLLLDGTTSLPGSSIETMVLSRLYPNSSRILTLGDVPALGAKVPDYEVIHFSGHAMLDDLGRPVLVFRGAQGDRYLGFSEIERWNLKRSRLVTLAGCNTGVGPLSDGESPWGLVPAFLNAGAPALMVSFLPVDDASAGQVVSDFYKNMAGGARSKADALRRAQLSFLAAHKNADDAGPISWAPYALIGDPR